MTTVAPVRDGAPTTAQLDFILLLGGRFPAALELTRQAAGLYIDDLLDDRAERYGTSYGPGFGDPSSRVDPDAWAKAGTP